MKFKKITAFLAVTAMLGTIAAVPVTVNAAAGDELIHQGDMEYADDNNIPYYWFAKTDGNKDDDGNETDTVSVARSDEQSHGGSYSLKVTDRASVSSGAGNYFVQPTADTTYRITAYIYPTETDTFHCRLSSGYWQDAGSAKGECEAGKWTKITADVTLSSWEQGAFHIYSENNTADFYVDDVSVVELSDEEDEPITPGDVAATAVNDDFSTFTSGTGSVPKYYSLKYTGSDEAYLSIVFHYETKVMAIEGLSGNLPDGNGILVNMTGSEAGAKLNLSLKFGTNNYGTTTYMKVYNVVDGVIADEALVTSDGCSGGIGNADEGTIDNFEFTIPEYSESYMVYLSPYTGVTAGFSSFKLFNLYINPVEDETPEVTHEEGFAFSNRVSLAELNKATITVTVNDNGTEKTSQSFEASTNLSGEGDAVVGIIVTDIPENVSITSINIE